MGGDVTGTTSAAATTKAAAGGGSLAEPQYVAVKTSVWWDIENCHVPKGCDPHAIAQNISSALVQMNYSGPVSISAYCDTNRIPPSVQQALSSTGIALNHVPAGVKDASDKKILVDMLFWAVDNPAPANYLLISGDRDFSNALHQLRMRRYNILLAQPQKASAALIAAAKSVWLWTSLSAGGPPLSSGESSKLANGHATSYPEVSYKSVPETVNNSKLSLGSEGVSVANQNSTTIGSNCDKKYKAYVRKTPSQPSMSRASRASTITSQESMNSSDSDQLDHAPAKPFKKAPHEFFGGSEPADSASKSNNNLNPSNCELSGSNETSSMGVSQSLHPRSVRPDSFPQQPTVMQDNLLPPSSQNHGFHPIPPRAEGPRFYAPAPQSMLNIGKLNMSEYLNYSQPPPNFQHRYGKEFKASSIELPNQPSYTVQQKNHVRPGGQAVQHNPFNQKYSRGSDFRPPSSSMVGTTPNYGIWGTQRCPPPSEYVQGLIGIILLALNTLKNEKIVPIEANISDCIRYGDLKKNINVRKALDLAVEQRMVVKLSLGSVQMYIGSNDKLWDCVNTIGGDPSAYPETTWDKIQKFFTSSDGKSAILASECRYEAALALKNACLQELALGEVLQILSMIVSVKKWIINHPSGWQPITISVEE